MTYIKSEATPNQSPHSISEILYLGVAAAQQQDWLSVNNYLKLLPQTKSRKKAKEFVLNGKDWQTAFDLALSSLIKADFQSKWSIAKLLPLFGSNIVSVLIELLQDRTLEIDTRGFICQILGNFSDRRVILALVELLHATSDRELIETAGKNLTKIGDDAIEALSELLNESEYRLLAVQSLFYIRTSKTIAPLITVATNGEAELKAIAIKALSSFHDSRIPPVLIAALQDKASNVRQEAAIALGFRPDICVELNLVEHLQPLLRDFNLEVCQQAAISLSRMKQETATAAIYSVLQADTTPEALKLDLVKALGWSEISSGIAYLAKTLVDCSDLVAQESVTILGRTKIPELKLEATKVLIHYWQQQNRLLESPQLRQTLATSLGELRCPIAKATLEQLAADGDRKVQLHAISALKKLA